MKRTAQLKNKIACACKLMQPVPEIVIYTFVKNTSMKTPGFLGYENYIFLPGL